VFPRVLINQRLLTVSVVHKGGHMSLKMSSPWKHPKTGVYWIRRRVPAHLVAIVGRSEEKQSLRTKDPAEAKRAFSLAMAAIEERWANLKRGVHTLSPRESVNLARAYYDGMIDEFRDQPLLQTNWDVEIGATCFQPSVPARSAGLTIDEREVRRTIMESWCRDFAGLRLSQSGVPVTSENIEILARSIGSALQAAALELKRLSSVSAFGRPAGTVSGSSDAIGDRSSLPMAKSKPVPAKDIFDGWAGERRPNQKTLYSYERVLEAFIGFVGEDDVAIVTQKNVADWKADLLSKGLSAKTIAASKLGALRAVFQWATDNGVISENPFAKVSISVKKKPGERRRGYSDDEAALVLRAAEKEKSAHRRWVPLLCAYTGARVSEVSQLRKQDVSKQQGIWCIQLTPEAGSLKNASSERVIPLHPRVVDAGFVKFVDKLAAGPIFSEVPPDRFGVRGGNMTKLVSRWVRDELHISDPRVAPSHAWRHRFKTLCRRYGVSSDIGDALTGHSARTVADTYGTFEVSALYRELCKLP
jgi:integrase